MLLFHLQKYKFQAEDLRVLGHLGEGNFGTVMKMLFPKTNTQMAVKVSTLVEGGREGGRDSRLQD